VAQTSRGVWSTRHVRTVRRARRLRLSYMGHLADESGGAVFPIEAGQGIAMVLGKER
jgi:hypothetical protein